MPDVDGIELLRHVRQDDSLGSVPVVSKCSQPVSGLASLLRPAFTLACLLFTCTANKLVVL